MVRAVLDTNVWISAFLHGGVPFAIVRLARRRVITVAVSLDILREFDRVLAEKFTYPSEQRERFKRLIDQSTARVIPTESIDRLSHEPDNRILECAVEAQADVIVTGDKKHLLPLNEFRGIRIQQPADFLEQFTDQRG